MAGISTQVRILHGFTPRKIFTEVYAVTVVIMFTYEARVYTTASEQLEWLASKCCVPCQFLKLRHSSEYQVVTDVTRVNLKAFHLQ